MVIRVRTRHPRLWVQRYRTSREIEGLLHQVMAQRGIIAGLMEDVEREKELSQHWKVEARRYAGNADYLV